MKLIPRRFWRTRLRIITFALAALTLTLSALSWYSLTAPPPSPSPVAWFCPYGQHVAGKAGECARWVAAQPVQHSGGTPWGAIVVVVVLVAAGGLLVWWRR